ncbi:MAG: HIT family protein [Hyphomicrobiales bacterium]|nr:HIT family protein [Hyphomicrobiales bacterium]
MTNTAYDDSNVFAKILRGEMPVHKVYEDAKTLAFMDIMPRVDGHVLVIPKAPSRNILDVAPDDLAHVIAVTQKIARAAKQAFQADGVALHQFSEAAGGQVVFHLHFHVLPMKEGVAMRPAGVIDDQALIAQYADILRAVLTNS